MVKLLIIADDFTGALDTGVQFSKMQIPTVVILKQELSTDILTGDAEVIVVDTESRHIGAGEAAKRVKSIVQNARDMGIKYFYKKTDSTLRGNIGSELKALMDAYPHGELMFVPAFPKSGRATINGVQYVNGMRLFDTSFGQDPLNPVSSSFIPDIIGEQASVNTVIVDVNSLECSDSFKNADSTIYIFDGQTDEDLEKAGSFIKQKEKLYVTAGCAGFGEILPKLIDLDRKEKEDSITTGDTLIVCGSLNEASLKQIRHAEKCGLRSMVTAPEQILDEKYIMSQDGEEFIQSILNNMKNNRNLILKTVKSKESIDSYVRYGRELGMKKEDIHIAVAKNTGKLIENIMKRRKVGNLIVFGGDTAMGIIDAIGCRGIIPGSEILPGVAVSEVIGYEYPIRMVTKAGGFGDEDVIIKIIEYLEGK